IGRQSEARTHSSGDFVLRRRLSVGRRKGLDAQDRVSVAQDGVFVVRNDVFVAQDRLSVDQDCAFIVRDKVLLENDRVFVARNDITTARNNGSIVRNRGSELRKLRLTRSGLFRPLGLTHLCLPRRSPGGGGSL